MAVTKTVTIQQRLKIEPLEQYRNRYDSGKFLDLNRFKLKQCVCVCVYVCMYVCMYVSV